MPEICYLHKDPKKCAELYTDIDVISTPTAIHKVLSYVLMTKSTRTAYAAIKPYDVRMLSESLRNYVAWVEASKANYEWLKDFFFALLEEYEYRFDKAHPLKKYAEAIKNCDANKHFFEGNRNVRRFPLSVPGMFIVDDNFKTTNRFGKMSVINTHRKYYKYVNEHTGKWTKRNHQRDGVELNAIAHPTPRRLQEIE